MLNDFLLTLHISIYNFWVIAIIALFIFFVFLMVKSVKSAITYRGDKSFIVITIICAALLIMDGYFFTVMVNTAHDFQNMKRLAKNGYEIYIDGINVDADNINLDDYVMNNITINDDSRKILISGKNEG